MNKNPCQPDSQDNYSHEAEETLRLVARLPSPEELTERVHARLRHRLAIEQANPVRRSFWSLWTPAQRFQFAAAAALVVAVAGSSWSVYHSHSLSQAGASQAGAGARISPPAINSGTIHSVQRDAGQKIGQDSSCFSSADAKRVPPTLSPIKVSPFPKKKPVAGRAVAKPSFKPSTTPPSSAGGTAKAPSDQ